ncbi:hypothetical protein F5050DRAFT_1812375 [Lentinula boryana]|uniref:Uncharacterized protein n=1 Tax=Lentinula boryana TaxID=40481 RepID=A0ABQ8PYY1_9AGAR|nr:hypothetical protein F5050DRAFT_1812375 [Lentinula boryana]
MAPPLTQQAQRNQSGTLTSNTDNLDVPNQAEEPNPFLANAQSFVPYSESISALGGRKQTNVFGPTMSTALPTMEVNSEFAIGGNTKTLDCEIQTLYTATGMPVQVQTPQTVTRIM